MINPKELEDVLNNIPLKSLLKLLRKNYGMHAVEYEDRIVLFIPKGKERKSEK